MRNQSRLENITLRTAVLGIVLLLSTIGFGQSRAGLLGSVSDEQGGKIAGAAVSLISRTAIRLTTLTDKEGNFVFAAPSSGEYLIEVKAKGFSNYTSAPISFNSGEQQSLAIVVKVAGVSADVVVTATGTPQRAEEVAKVVSTIDLETLEARRSLSLTETLRGLPAVRIQQQGSPGALTTIRLRGQRTFDTALLLDGLRVRDASDINGSAVSLLADLVPTALERVEVLRGSGSSIYGTNAVGGVINLVPVSGSGHPTFEAGFAAGSLATFREHMKGSGGTRLLGYSFGLSRTDVRRGIDGQDEYGNSAGIGRFQFNPTSSLTITGNVYGTFANARINDSPLALPMAFTSGESFPRAKAGVNFQPDFNNPDQGRRNRLLVGALRLTHQLNEAVSYTIAYQRVSTTRRNYNGPGIDPAFQSFYPFGDFEFININNGSTDTLDARVHARLGKPNLFTAGFEFERESLFQQSIPSFSAFNNTTDRQRTFAFFGQDQLTLLDDRLHLSLGIRSQFFRLNASDRPGLLRGVDAENSVTGDAAISYFFASTGTKLRAHAGNGFRAPSLFERFGAGNFPGAGLTRFGDPTLKAEQSISVDGGVDQSLSRDRVLLRLTYFYTRLQRVIFFESFLVDPLGLGRFSGYVNEPGGLARGVESSIEARPLRSTEIRASYTYTNSDRSTSAGGLFREYVIPSHQVGFSLSQHYKSVLLRVDLNRTGAYIAPVFENNFPFRMAELTFAGYTKADVFASHERRISEDVTVVVFGSAENLLNQRYFENGFRAPGLLLRGGINLRF